MERRDNVATDPDFKIRIGVGLGVQEMIGSGAELRAVCRALEEEGFDSLWFSEVATSHALDPVAALGFVASATERIKMGTSVMVVPGRPPALLAKSIATLDLLSGGRVLPIFGLGTVEPGEQQAFGIERADRGPWVEEVVPLLRRLWSEESVAHAGHRFSLDGVGILPRPRRPLPVWLGGRDRRELRRVGRLGDGWLASFATPLEVSDGVAVITAAAAEHGRSIESDHYGVLLLYALREPSPHTCEFLDWRRPDLTLPEALPVGAAALRARLAEFIDAGASKFILIPADRPEDWQRELADLADAVLPMQTPARSDPIRVRGCA
jgi:probable F420-dependent oxidoreductase